MPAETEASTVVKDRGVPVRRRAHWTAHFIRFRFVGFLVILGVLGWVLFPRKAPLPELRPGEIEQQRLVVFNGLKLWKALEDFRRERGTAGAPWPADLTGVDGMRSLLAVKAEFAGDWWYFPQADPKTKQAALLISPRLAAAERPPLLGQQVVIRTGGAIQVLTPEAVEKLVKTSPVPPVRVAAPLLR